MPLVEGHWQRQQTPLRRLTLRERRLLQAFAAALVVASIAIAAFSVLHRSAPIPAGCIEVTGPSTMGAAIYRACGADAERWCRDVAGKDPKADPTARAVQARCRALALSRR
jgi:hypothetical protein